MQKMRVDFIDLKAQYMTIKNEVNEAIQSVIEQSSFSSGPFVKTFEENFAKAHGAKYCVGVNSGTSALHIALWALGIGRGDEVIVPSNTFFATPEAVSLTGATPVFVDCEPDYYNIDPDKIESAVKKSTKCIIAVNLYGQPAMLDKIREIADRRGLLLIEDCAQSHLAEYKGKHVGTFGICGCFSFYPAKNLGAYGEGGAVITNHENLYNSLLALREHGSVRKYYHERIGHNYRMDGIQGAVLGVKLKHLSSWTESRRNNSALYRRYLIDCENIVLPAELLVGKHVYHLFVVRVPERTKLMAFLSDCGISTGIHYPVPCHLQKAYSTPCCERSSLPFSEKYAEEILSLPMYAELKEEQIKYVSEKIKDFYRQ